MKMLFSHIQYRISFQPISMFVNSSSLSYRRKTQVLVPTHICEQSNTVWRQFAHEYGANANRCTMASMIVDHTSSLLQLILLLRSGHFVRGLSPYYSNHNREVVQITPRFGVQLIRNCTTTTVALHPVICTLGPTAMLIWRQVHPREQWKLSLIHIWRCRRRLRSRSRRSPNH